MAAHTRTRSPIESDGFRLGIEMRRRRSLSSGEMTGPRQAPLLRLVGWVSAPAIKLRRYHTPKSAAWRSLDLTYLEATTYLLLRLWCALASVRQNVMYCIGSRTDQGQQSN